MPLPTSDGDAARTITMHARSDLAAPPTPAFAVETECRDESLLRRLRRVSRLVFPRRNLKHTGERALLIWRYLRNLPHSRQWLDFLEQGPMAALTAANPHLYKKIIRPYACRSWDGARKLAALMAHYRFWLAAVPGEVLPEIITEPGLVLHQFTVPEDTYSVRLRYDSKYNKEGELTLELFSLAHRCRLSALAFLIHSVRPDQREMLIGCVQGLPAAKHRDIIKQASRKMHGLRPKALLFHLAQAVAETGGIASIAGVGNQEHVSRHPDYALNRSRQPKLGYDEFWLELDGQPRPDGFFALPNYSPPRAYADIPAHKRALYRRRYELLVGLRQAVRLRLAGLGVTPNRSA